VSKIAEHRYRILWWDKSEEEAEWVSTKDGPVEFPSLAEAVLFAERLQAGNRKRTYSVRYYLWKGDAEPSQFQKTPITI
jgi:hypothetical protein